MNYPFILEDEEAFKSTATVAALATANRTGVQTPPARDRGGPGARDRGRGVVGPPRGRGNQNRGRGGGGGQPQPRQYPGPSHSHQRGRFQARFMTVLNPQAASHHQNQVGHRPQTSGPRHPPPPAGPSSAPPPPAGVSTEQAGPIQISSESDSDDGDEAPY